jgi:hypothetical protein
MLVISATIFASLVGCQPSEPALDQDAPTPLASLATPTADEPTITPTPVAEATATPLPATAVPTAPSPEMAENEANADVLNVRAVQAAGGSWTFHVTVFHPDTGWDDYADGWDILLPDGTVIKPDADAPFTRLLLHPHENEQPFTRSQSNILIPDDVTEVRVRAHDLVHGYGGRETIVDLTVESGPDFSVER